MKILTCHLASHHKQYIIHARHSAFFNIYFFARLAQACSPIGGVLFVLNGKHRLQCGNTEDSCTSQLCQWIIPRDHKQTPKPVSELSFVRPVLYSESRKETSINFDPRHPQDRIIDLMNALDQLKEFKKLFPNTGMYKINVSFCLDIIQKTGS